MNKAFLSFICCVIACVTAGAQPQANSPAGSDFSRQMNQEKAHFLECLSFVYQPAFWFSYNDSLYFTPMTEEHAGRLEEMKLARASYVAFVDRKQRHELAQKGIAAAGADAAFQKKLLLPYSVNNEHLTPTLSKALRILPTYTVLQRLGKDDALVQDSVGAVYFVMNFGRALDDSRGTNGLFIKEGEKTYTTQSGGRNTVEAFTSVGLNTNEVALLSRISAEFKRQATALKPPVIAPRVIAAADRDEFELLKSRATDSNPYMQFLVAKAYLDGKGTPKDQATGLEWMRRASRSGSGDAKRYLETLK